IHLEGKTLDQALTAARNAGLPLYLKLEEGIVIGGSRRDAELAALKGAQTRYLCDYAGKKYFLITGKLPLKEEELSKLGSILLTKGTAALIAVDGEIMRSLLPFGAKAIPLPESPLPNPPAPKILLGKELTYDPAIAALVAQVDTASVRNYLLRLQSMSTRFLLAENRFAVAESIRQWFLDMGISDVKLDTFYTTHYDPWGNNMQVNVVATIPGTQDTSSAIIVGGHHDSYSENPYVLAPGVDDNGTGTVAALEMARILAANPPERTIRCMTFAAEEYGLYGSFHYAYQAAQAGMKIFGMFNYDMIGHYENTNTYVVFRYSGAEYLGNLLGQATQLYTYLTPIYSTGGYGSDSYSFWQYGFPATWGFEALFSTKYHTVHDSIAYVSVPYCTEVIRAGLAAVASAAKYPDVVRQVTVTDVGDGARLVVGWQPNVESNLIGYKLYYGRSSGNYSDTVFTADCSDTLEGLMTDSLYYISVRAVNSNNYESIVATEVTGTPRLAPAPPAPVIATPVANGIRVDWKKNTELDLAGYRLYQAVNDTSSYDSLTAAVYADTTYNDNFLSGANRYYYKVRAFDLDGNCSPLSNRAYGRPFTLDQGILLVDETNNWTSGSFPRDVQQDSFYEYLLAGYQHEQYDFGGVSQKPVLADLGPYSTVVWHSDDPSMFLAANDSGVLRNYVSHSGKLWFTGWKPTADIRNSASYPADFAAGELLYDWMKVVRAELSGMTDSFRTAVGLRGYPDIMADTTKYPATIWGKVMRYIEALTPAAGADTIYVMDMKNNGSAFEGKACAVRDSGKTVLFGFPLYFMDKDQARLAAQKVMSEFGEPYIGVEGKPGESGQRTAFRLDQNAPNPFTTYTAVSYELPALSKVEIAVYNVAGQKVRTLASGMMPAGAHSVKWDGRDQSGAKVSAGVYLYRMSAKGGSASGGQAGGKDLVGKMTLLR
ncbi:MAG: M28 family peptidase, partial [Candidatus Edwardsbacteria bacterium]|nr:M28 family peptidase [Candidatus Edwardsbacteria bacterium]